MNSKDRVIVLLLNDLISDSRVLKECKSLNKRFSVEILCLKYKGSDYEEWDRKFDFKITRIHNYPKSSVGVKKKINQLIAYLKYSQLAIRHLKNTDIIHCNDLETLPVGVFKKIFNKSIKVVYDAHEYESETMWMKNRYKKYLTKLVEKFLIKFVDKIIVVSESIGTAYRNDYNLPYTPTTIYNLPNSVEKIDKICLKQKIGIPNSDTLYLFQGGLSKGRGIEIILEAFKLKKSTVHILFMGSGFYQETIERDAKIYPNIHWTPPVPQDKLLMHTCSADIGVLSYENTCKNHDFAAPNKLFEYLMAGIPILGSPLTEIKKFIKINNVGEVYKDFSVNSIIESSNNIERKAEELQSTINNIRLKYSWENQEDKFLGIYEF